MALLKSHNTRCNLCSLGCFVALAETPRGLVECEFRQDVPALRRGVCNRGNMTAELLRHVRRLLSAKVCREGSRREVRLDEAVRVVADAVSRCAGSLVIDGGLPCEDIGAALTLAAASNGRISASVYLPPEDESALNGLSASGAAFFTPEDLATCDAILVVGDAFATHPGIARPVHEARRHNPRLPLVVVDSIPGRTGIFASFPVTVKPGAESRALAAIAAKAGVTDLGSLVVAENGDAPLNQDLTVNADGPPQRGASPISAPDAIANAARVLAGAKKLGVILRAEPGKASNWDQVAYLAGKLAVAKGGGVAACLTCGNAMGAYRLAKAYVAQPLAPTKERPSAEGTTAITGEGACATSARVLIALGTDPATTRSKSEAAALNGLKMLVAANAMPVPTMERADVALPMTFNFEAGGTVVTGSGEIITVDSVADAPGEAVPAGELAGMLAKALGIAGVARGFDRAAAERMPKTDASGITGRAQAAPVAVGVGEFVAVTQSDCIHAHTGSLTSMCAWPQYMAPEPLVAMSATDAATLGVKHNGRVRLVSLEGTCEGKADVSKMQPAGVVAVSSGFAASRGLFAWTNGRTGPTTVKVERL